MQSGALPTPRLSKEPHHHQQPNPHTNRSTANSPPAHRPEHRQPPARTQPERGQPPATGKNRTITDSPPRTRFPGSPTTPSGRAPGTGRCLTRAQEVGSAGLFVRGEAVCQEAGDRCQVFRIGAGQRGRGVGAHSSPAARGACDSTDSAHGRQSTGVGTHGGNSASAPASQQATAGILRERNQWWRSPWARSRQSPWTGRHTSAPEPPPTPALPPGAPDPSPVQRQHSDPGHTARHARGAVAWE